ncbi:MAG TPA: hypothetical protein VHD32_16115 [Candidatus Didemnitutus sp.]|nr:hypothetical protein [Candidatus Didemnitutus sp.]
MSDPTPPPATPAAPAPKSSGSKVVIIIVCIVLGFFLLVGGCVATCTYLGAKKLREVSQKMKEKPGYASYLGLQTLVRSNPDLEVVSSDGDKLTLTVRNVKTGKTETIDASKFTADNIQQEVERLTQSAQAMARSAQAAAANADASTIPSTSGMSAGKAAALDNIVRKLPASAPGYPGGATQDAVLNAVGNVRTAQYSFLSLDKIDAILDFYEGKAKAAGYEVVGRQGATNDAGPTGTLTLSRTTPPGAITITAESHAGGRLAVSVTLTETGN